ncbi:GTP-binding protein, partial [Synechococcus sp. OH2]
MSQTEPESHSWIEKLIRLTHQTVARAGGKPQEPWDWAGHLFKESLLEAEAEMGHCNVLVIGKSGVGKSTLV